MSQLAAVQASSSTKPPSREIEPTSSPISTLSTPLAQALASVHPLLLAAYFYSRFPSLVADPVSTLLTDLGPLSVLQCAYATVCLPVSKRSPAVDESKAPATPSKSKTARPKPAKSAAASAEASLGSRISNAVLSLLLTAIATLPIFAIFVLFGAPLTTHYLHTLLCAAHFSLLAALPLFYAHGVDKQAWWEIGGAMLPFDGVWGTTVGAALGAWLGAVPIPLDWDREWQKWPVTIVAGVYAGAVVGKVAGEYLLHGKRMKFVPEKA